MRLYLVDSIVKNVKSAGSYADYFSDNLVKVFLHVFQRVNIEPFSFPFTHNVYRRNLRKQMSLLDFGWQLSLCLCLNFKTKCLCEHVFAHVFWQLTHSLWAIGFIDKTENGWHVVTCYIDYCNVYDFDFFTSNKHLFRLVKKALGPLDRLSTMKRKKEANFTVV